jgi:hypothetical protein
MAIRLLFAILGLLLCGIAARADKPIVIKDSEAIQYVGKEVEVCGRLSISEGRGTRFCPDQGFGKARFS